MSLIEILVALTILAFALLGLMPLFAGAVKTAASSYQLTNANTLVREKLEELTGYPRGDARLNIPDGATAAVPTGVKTTGSGGTACTGPNKPPGCIVVTVNTFCNNDLPSWYDPATGQTSFASTSPGTGWYAYPYERTYTVEQFGPLPVPAGGPTLLWMTTPVTAPNPYTVKLVTVTARPTRGPFPGLRQTTQSLYLRFPNG